MLAEFPLLILAIGIVTVLGMILALKINAFISLITAALVVSLLSEGDFGVMVARVATAFGEGAGNIGIVIALAAVIGKCMMDSGAADRVVRAFLSLLGEKNASFALMGSGFVLAVPVFFDTVFYLLVPLARSLYRRTNRNYLMYILAIAAGGAITHTLVPPTPGPLVMAATLGIDVGYMILVGTLVALPAAFAGIVYASVADRMMHIPMRSPGTEPEPLEDHELPSLFMSLLPVVLPVLLISANTVLNTLADNAGAQYVRVDEVEDFGALRDAIVEADPNSPGGRVHRFLSDDVSQSLDLDAPTTDEEKQALVADLNAALARRIESEDGKTEFLYDDAAFASVVMPQWEIRRELDALSEDDPARDRLERQQLLATWAAKDRDGLKPIDRERFHRIALDAAFPEGLKRHEWNTPIRKWAEFSALFGNPNLALLLATAVALFVLWQQRRPTLVQLAETVEESLMSGGVIILITAAGVAFGAMLKVAKVGPAIEQMFSTGGGSSGMFYLFLGFGLAALLKVAQGSSTAAMIIGSGMLAPVVAGANLGFHPVYIATAIGSGSLIGSWMNDSGFWIFAKMGGLTEAEALKSWTPLLIVLGLVGMGTTLLLATVMPLT
jgi:gluconate:H+ symporter, GntP family